MTRTLTRAALIWLPLAVVATLVCAVIYVVAQQVVRIGADEPQIGLAQAAAQALDAGATPLSRVGRETVDSSRSGVPFTIVADTTGKLLATDGSLDGRPLLPPPGLLATARETGMDRVTWQPEAGVRLAQVTVRWGGGTVTVARSLAETERLEDVLLLIVAAGLAGTLLVLGPVSLVVAWATVSADAQRRAR